MNRHRHTAECYASNATGPLAYTPCREDGLDRNLINMKRVDFEESQRAHDVVKGLTLICPWEAPERLPVYFTCVVPFVPLAFRTEWHPTTNTGPFRTLHRGAFASEAEAIEWGKAHLGGCPYSVREIDPNQD